MEKYSDIVFVNMFYGAPPVLFEFAKRNRENPTQTETLLWNALSDKKLIGFRFRRQHPLRYFIADFYCHKAKLVIEIDGGYHNLPDQYQYDRSRDDELTALGIHVLHFTNEEILFQIEFVLESIESVLNTPNPLKGAFGAMPLTGK